MDPRDLNEALEREPYHTRSVDEITAKLQGMTVFTIVDFKKGYWMVVLHPDSRKLTCMALPFGRFQWIQLPMGTFVAQDIFQSKLDAIFIGMEGVTGIADDMIIAGKDEMKHDRNFLAFMGKCMENNLTLNLEEDTIQTNTGMFLWSHLVEAWHFTRSKEDTGSEAYGVPTRQGNHEIFPRNDQLFEQVLCTQCTSCSTPQCTHASGYRLQTRKSSSGELPLTEDGNFQYEGTSIL